MIAKEQVWALVELAIDNADGPEESIASLTMATAVVAAGLELDEDRVVQGLIAALHVYQVRSKQIISSMIAGIPKRKDPPP